ncbi:MAG TPA: deoxyribonuclease IV [Candidatus Limnocylindrales bacterium]|jgi:deoxyribonuclease IV|nr:deoxyribonuclease IV [Candidatus Limnocylindrales bacterium]
MSTQPGHDARLIGLHLPLGGGLLKAADRASVIGARTIQVFTDNPTAWRRRSGLPAQLAEFRARLAGHGIGPIAVHAPYLVNLAGADAEFWQRSVATLVNDLAVAEAFGARFLNVHAGSHRGHSRVDGIRRLGEGIARVLREAPAAADREARPLLVVENSVGAGETVGNTLEELAEVVAAADRFGAPIERVGVCLDTAHLWAYGYRLDRPKAVDVLAERAHELLGDRLVMIHLNDARTACGSRVDRHEHIGAGQIGAAAIRRLLEHPRLGRLPTVLETPGMDAGYDLVNMERVRLLLAGNERLPVLPPEAFQTRGSRSRSAPPAADEA